ncbi:MAG: magnesium chelatase, partial [Geminicoccales bacterium]
SNAERRALVNSEEMAVARATDIYAALPSMTGKFELEYEGELRGADNVARDIIRAAVGVVFSGWYANADLRQVAEWFDLGGTLQIDDTLPAGELLKRTSAVQGLSEMAGLAGGGGKSPAPVRAAAVDFVLEGLYAQKKISRSDEWQYHAAEPARRAPRGVPADPMIEREIPLPGNKKKYYN